MKHKGFTLAEVLIALALLGVVAAFAIPKVLQSTTDAKRVALLKETLGMIYNIEEEGRLKQTLTPTNMASFFSTKANAIQACDTNSQTQGCWQTGIPIPESVSEAGFILPNGVAVIGFNNCCSTTPTMWENAAVIDWNGLASPNKLGDDQVWISMCYGPGSCNSFFTTGQPSGSIRPNINASNYTNAGYTATDITNNTTLFQKVSQ